VWGSGSEELHPEGRLRHRIKRKIVAHYGEGLGVFLDALLVKLLL
jgi:hypothetical protein